MSLRNSIFEIIKKHEASLPPGSYPTFYVKEKNVGQVITQIIESIPMDKAGERRFWIDVRDALTRGKLRISRTTLKLESNR